ncbi:hypothetical protein B5V01_27195 [Mesorhizobium erdmanii]|uniref:Uncharacterized protein n=1 Tax=Mesorhizobium erdmanii TaxID=1777866 RepID=A0A4Q1URW5_9HYPH|nr:hypothetical protein B5V01_27195 [Mesorhizobium erdmanii]
MTGFIGFPDINHRDAERRPISQRPDEILNDPAMSRAEKRALLASWASDARAVPARPSMRQLEDGSHIEVDEILQALKALDADICPSTSQQTPGLSQRPAQRRVRLSFPHWTRIVRHRRRDDDDDPPPCPVFAADPPRTGGGGAFAHPEPALA